MNCFITVRYITKKCHSFTYFGSNRSFIPFIPLAYISLENEFVLHVKITAKNATLQYYLHTLTCENRSAFREGALIDKSSLKLRPSSPLLGAYVMEKPYKELLSQKS